MVKHGNFINNTKRRPSWICERNIGQVFSKTPKINFSTQNHIETINYTYLSGKSFEIHFFITFWWPFWILGSQKWRLRAIFYLYLLSIAGKSIIKPSLESNSHGITKYYPTKTSLRLKKTDRHAGRFWYG